MSNVVRLNAGGKGWWCGLWERGITHIKGDHQRCHIGFILCGISGQRGSFGCTHLFPVGYETALTEICFISNMKECQTGLWSPLQVRWVRIYWVTWYRQHWRIFDLCVVYSLCKSLIRCPIHSALRHIEAKCFVNYYSFCKSLIGRPIHSALRHIEAKSFVNYYSFCKSHLAVPISSPSHLTTKDYICC